jgi:A/G-specific adenine glycosylase
VEDVAKLEPFTHAFTHFTLAVTPWLVRVKGKHDAAGAGGTIWLALPEAGTAALPAPVKRLLARLASEARKPSRARGRGGAR